MQTFYHRYVSISTCFKITKMAFFISHLCSLFPLFSFPYHTRTPFFIRARYLTSFCHARIPVLIKHNAEPRKIPRVSHICTSLIEQNHASVFIRKHIRMSGL